ncbi:MAG: 50S ribosomal protein L4 [Thermodesulfobacteriota bacterium]
MTTLTVYNIWKEKVMDLDLDDRVFDVEVKPFLLYDGVRTYLASQRRGTAATKNKALVRGGGAKPYRQKGTGRARAGSRRSPLWRGGGTIFGPMPRDYELSLPKKVKRASLRMALTLKRREGKLMVLDQIPLNGFKTREVKQMLGRFQIEEALIVTDEKNPFLERSARNIPGVKVLRYDRLNLYDLLNYDHLVFLQSAIQKIQGGLLS